MPAVALVDPGGTMVWIDVYSNYTTRTKPVQILDTAHEILTR